MKYFPIKAATKNEQRQREDVISRVHAEQITKPFLADYSDFVCDAFRKAARNNRAFAFSMPETWNTPIAGSLTTPHLNLHILQSVPLKSCDGSAHIVIMQDKASKAYIVMHGESMKKWLESFKGYGLPFKKDPVEEVADIIALWKAFSDEIKKPYGPDFVKEHQAITPVFSACVQPFRDRLGSIAKSFLHRTYGDKINWGKILSAQSPK